MTRFRILTVRIREVYGILYDEMGDLGWWPGNSPDEVVVGAILTQNTSWKNVEKSLEVLRSECMLDLSRLAEADSGDLSMLIRSSGFHNQKASRLIDTSRRIIETYGSLRQMLKIGDQEASEFLFGIKGVGEETRDSILLYALDKPVFVMDKYAGRIFSRVGLIRSKDDLGKFPERAIEELGSDIGKLKNFHGMVVQLAKDHCRKKPICSGCPLSGLCEYYREAMLP